ncbi:hypothetical protein JG688_00016380 [Phytophthora aleatoria]|uniref:Uncharacterized protein n=1 Tax=Phytophthora aleatoria TaxID=2496075 RepID=A0A8J5IFV9_9STRA|nr:hypothetical protein JG688_00016380 [Phytophthora aleatoria]
MTKHRGSTNYSSGEKHCLLNLIRKHIPVASAEWEAVLAQPQWKARNGASLKRKFRNMCIASKQAGTELAGATRWVQSMMTMKKRGEAKQEPSRCSTNEPPDTRRVPLDVPQQAVDPVVSYPARDVEQLLLWLEQCAGLQSDSAGDTAVTTTQQLRKLFRQRKSNQRVARRHHNEILQYGVAKRHSEATCSFWCWSRCHSKPTSLVV